MTLARYGHIGSAKATTLSVAVNSAVTSMTVTDASTWSGITTNGPAVFTIDRGLSTEERILIASVSGNNLTSITRGIDGTTAAAHDPGANIEHTFSGIEADDANAHIYDTTRDDHTQYQKKSLLTATGDIAYASGASTWARLAIGTTNKVLGVVGGIPAWISSTTSTLTATGDLVYASAANTLARLGIGSTGQVLTVVGGLPAWSTGGVTEFAIPASAFGLMGNGTPTFGNAASTSGYIAGWAFADAATSFVQATFVMPPGWASLGVDLWCTNSGAGAGNVRMETYVAALSSGANVTTGGTTEDQTIAAPATNIVTKFPFTVAGKAATAGQLMILQVGRLGSDGADTLTANFCFVGCRIYKVS